MVFGNHQINQWVSVISSPPAGGKANFGVDNLYNELRFDRRAVELGKSCALKRSIGN